MLMKRNILDRDMPAWVPALLSVILAAAGILQYAGFLSEKALALVAGVGILLLLSVGDLKRLMNWPSLFLMGYAAFSMFTIAWAMSGKFFLWRYSCIFVAVFFFLLVVLWKRNDRHFVRHVLSILVGVCTLYALAGLEGAATHHISNFLYANPSAVGMSNRLSGVFHNSNIEASFYAMGILFSVALICDGEKKRLSRAVWSVTLAINAVAMILGISLGAIASLAGGVIAYLIFSGRGRIAVMLRLAEGLLPAAVCAVLMVPYFHAETKPEFPLVITLLCAAITMVLELNVVGRAASMLERYDRIVAIALVACTALALCYAIAALNVSVPYTFGGTLDRGIVLSPGEHTVQFDADGDVNVKVYSRSREEIMRGYTNALTNDYGDNKTDVSFEGLRFVVPEDSAICLLQFSAEEGTTIRSATVDGNKKVMLTYRLLPSFVAQRLQGGLTANSSYVLRYVLWQNGLKLFRLSPLFGNGVGSFETGLTRVQDFYYETRYVHQHYIQVLLECGVIGFALYAGALIAMFAALWKKRRTGRNETYFWLYPALIAEMVMNGLQMLWDVSMSIMAFLTCTYAVYGLVVVTAAEPIRMPFSAHTPQPAEVEENAQQAEAPDEEATDAVPAPRGVSLPTRAILMLLPLMYMFTICGNIYASMLVARQFESYEEAFSTLERAAGLDIYEKNDIMLTYILMSMENEGQDNHISQANIYADELSRVQSNRLPYYLAGYYFNTMQYSRSIEEAKLGAVYSASDNKQWNMIIDLLKEGFIDSGEYSPLLTENNGAELVNRLAEYRQMLVERNATAVKPVSLTESSQSFMDTVYALEQCGDDQDAIRTVLVPTGQAE